MTAESGLTWRTAVTSEQQARLAAEAAAALREIMVLAAERGLASPVSVGYQPWYGAGDEALYLDADGLAAYGETGRDVVLAVLTFGTHLGGKPLRTPREADEATVREFRVEPARLAEIRRRLEV